MSAGPETSSSSKRPSASKKLAVLGGTLVVVFAAIEIGLRLAGYDPVGALRNESGLEDRFMIQESDDPVLIYEFAPGASGVLLGSEMTINSDGLRERAVPFDKPAGMKRVLAVGDSVTWGPKLDTTQRWSDVIGARWGEWGVNAEIINLGVPGYDVAQEVRFLERKGLAYHPDEVLMCFCVNDLETASFDFETIVAMRRLQSGLLGWSRAAQWVTLRLDKVRQVKTQAEIWDAERIRIASADITPDPQLEALIAKLRAAIERAGQPGPVKPGDSKSFKDEKFRTKLLLFTELGRLQLVRNAFERLAELSRENDFGVAVFIAPLLYEGLDEEGWPIAYEIIRHLAESAGFSFVDVYPEMKEAGLDALRVQANDYVHINAFGHGLMARTLLVATRRWFL